MGISLKEQLDACGNEKQNVSMKNKRIREFQSMTTSRSLEHSNQNGCALEQ